jgi:hypothetical protein
MIHTERVSQFVHKNEPQLLLAIYSSAIYNDQGLSPEASTNVAQVPMNTEIRICRSATEWSFVATKQVFGRTVIEND